MKSTTNTLEYHWLPFTSNSHFKQHPRLIESGNGIYLKSVDGNTLVDGSSGLFCVPAGHGRKEIAKAVHDQLLHLDYGLPFQCSHPGPFELARLIALQTPGNLNRIFFTNSGSESIDTALKIALAYHRARGEGTRMRMVSRERAYHGVNIGGTSLSGMVKNREAFGIGMAGVSHMRDTVDRNHPFVRGQAKNGAELADDLERIIMLHGTDTVAAVFVEPIAGSAGCLVPPEGYLQRLRQICDKYGVLLIFDEVICGFGRTGKAFAAQSFGVTPDMITMAKALTNGNIPMGAVAASEAIYETINNAAPERAVALFHGYTYSGHPVACAAGIATMKIYEDEQLFARAADLSEYFLDGIFSLQDIPAVVGLRGYGLMAAIDLAADGAPGVRGYDAQIKTFEAGLNIKMTGDVCIVAPPFISERKHIDQIIEILRQVFSQYY